MSDHSKLGELLADFRQSLDRDQKEVASDLSIPPSSLSFYENGKRIPPHDILVRILDYYGARLTVEADSGKWTFEVEADELRLKEITDDEEPDLLTGLEPEEREDLITYIRRRKHRNK